MATPPWLTTAVSEFGNACKAKLAGPGDREAAIRGPLENLLGAAGRRMKLAAVFHDEVRDSERRVRPDYAVSVGGAITGYVEVKAPGKSVDPTSFRGHDKDQWERQRDLPNLLYTNGTDWWLWRDGERHGEAVSFSGGALAEAGEGLRAPEAFERLITDFLRWKPAPITSVGALVRAIAPLTRLLRGEVLDQLEAERRALASGSSPEQQPFTGLAKDWRALLFPEAKDETFADGYAQTVTFALLLARAEGIDIRSPLHEVAQRLTWSHAVMGEAIRALPPKDGADAVAAHARAGEDLLILRDLAGSPLRDVAQRLAESHSLMGRALGLLTDDVAKDFAVVLDLLVRVVGAVNWPRVRKGKRDTYLHLYEHFLESYDNDLRKQSGTYYTPIEVVEPMVRLAEEALTTRLAVTDGFRDERVSVVDPAMGTGTFLLAVLRRIAEQVESSDGRGAVRSALAKASGALTGFELQMGPFAVAELRTADLLASHGVPPEERHSRLYVTNTLDDPFVAQTQLTHSLLPIARSRQEANEVKAKANVTVVIGNPPYGELRAGQGGWVESGSRAEGMGVRQVKGVRKQKARAILEDFFDPAAGRFKAKLKNLYVYFWRWATWKVWESTPSESGGDAGIVCFITTSAYRTGPAFTGMRAYLRRWASEGWIIDLTPEGHTPDVPTRIFPGVRQPLAIGLFVRRQGTSHETAATVRTRAVSGRQRAKFAALARLTLDDDGWETARDDWDAPFTSAAASGWDDYPAISDILPWYSPGVFPTRGWVIAPSAEVLRRRWNRLRTERDEAVRSTLFKEGRDANLAAGRSPLPGADVHLTTAEPLATDRTTLAAPVRYGYRAFDREWIIPDHRVMDMPRRDLWSARVPGQVFVVEQHRRVISDGPGLVFTALIPDFDHFKGSEGGRTLPFLHPDGTANLARGTAETLADRLGVAVSAADVLAYVAAITAHPGFTATFRAELETPGVRVPITADGSLWQTAVALGRQVLWLHTYGAVYADADHPEGDVRLPPDDPRRVQNTRAVAGMPQTMTYDPATETLHVGDGRFAPVAQRVWEYTVGGRGVLGSWFNYRKAEPGGRKGSPLDDEHVTTWPSDWNGDLLDLLSVLTRLVGLEGEQAALLERVLAGEVLTMADLAARPTQERPAVTWPAAQQDRKPRFPVSMAALGGTG